MECSDKSALKKSTGGVYMVCSLIIGVTAIVLFIKIKKLQSFTFLKNQTLLILIYAFTLFWYSIELIGAKSILFQIYCMDQPWYIFTLGITFSFVGAISETLVFWNLAFMYWSST